MKNLIAFTQNKNYHQWAPLFLRLITGASFLLHGWAKLSRGPALFGKLLLQLHVPFPETMAWISTLTELIGGAMILLGAFVSLMAIPLIGTMLVAMFTIHIHYGFSAVKTIGLSPQGPLFGPPGYEINLVYIACLLALITGGAGLFSIDSYLNKKNNTQ